MNLFGGRSSGWWQSQCSYKPKLIAELAEAQVADPLRLRLREQSLRKQRARLHNRVERLLTFYQEETAEPGTASSAHARSAQTATGSRC